MKPESGSQSDLPAAGDSAGAGIQAQPPPPSVQPATEARIQFSDDVKPTSKNPAGGNIATLGPALSRTQSIVSIPQVVSASEKKKLQREKDQQKRHVDIDEHLVPHAEVAARYQTRINLDHPEKSLGLTSEQANELLLQHGKNILTPPKKRHPILQYFDYLTSLFNLLLILAGVLEYILLGINYKANFQNVSCARQAEKNYLN